MDFKLHCFEMIFDRFLMSMKVLVEAFEQCLHKFVKGQTLFHSYNVCGIHREALSQIISWNFLPLLSYVSILKSVPEIRVFDQDNLFLIAYQFNYIGLSKPQIFAYIVLKSTFQGIWDNSCNHISSYLGIIFFPSVNHGVLA